MKKLSILTATLLSGALVLTACSKTQSNSSEQNNSSSSNSSSSNSTEEKKTRQAFDFSAMDKDGNTVKLSDYKGKKVYINVWASWCGPCVREMPELEKAYQKLKDKEDVIGWGHLVGAGILAGLAFFLIKNKKGRKFLVIALIGGGSLVYAMQDTGAYSGTEIKETTFIASDQELKTPEIDGYHFVGVIKLEDACVFNTPSDETPADNQKEEKPKTEKPNNKKEEQPKTEKPDNKKEEKPKSDNPKTNKEEQTVKPAEIQFNFTKAYHGGTLKAGQFKFEMRDSSGKVVQTATNDEKENILFQSIKFKDNEVGTHTYTISEVKGTEENTEYDKMISTVTVTVTKSDDKLVAKITKIVSANGIDGKLKSTNGQADTEFNNSYIEPITVAPSDHLDD